MKRKIITSLIVLSLAFANVTGVWANGIPVLLNGEPLNYTLVDPIIINDRVMVPIRETAEFLGITTEWFEDSSTMSFTKGDNTAVHTLNQNFIITNGKVVTFDTPSQVVNDRTLMPVRMLAEALGASVQWDDTNRQVIITTEQTPAQTAPTTQEPSPSADASQQSSPSISAAIPENTTVVSGAELKINVLANSSTNKLKVTDATMKVLVETDSYYTTGPNHVFSVTYTPTAETQTNLSVVITPYTSGGSVGLPKTLYFTIEPADKYSQQSSSDSSGSSFSNQTETVYINSVNVSPDKIKTGESVTVNAVTTNGAVSVWIKDSYGNTFGETSSHTKDDSGRFQWSLSFSPTNSGSYYLYAKDADGVEVSNQFTITVDNGYSSSSDGLRINNISTSSTNVNSGEDVTVKVSTTLSAERVWIVDPYGSTLYENSYYSTNGDYREWEFNIHPYASGSYQIHAADSSNREVSDSVYIYVN